MPKRVKKPAVERQTQRGRGLLDSLAKEQGRKIIDVIKEAVVKTGSVYGAAQLLNVVPSTVRYHLKKAGLAVRVRMIVEFISLDESNES